MTDVLGEKKEYEESFPALDGSITSNTSSSQHNTSNLSSSPTLNTNNTTTITAAAVAAAANNINPSSNNSGLTNAALSTSNPAAAVASTTASSVVHPPVKADNSTSNLINNSNTNNNNTISNSWSSATSHISAQHTTGQQRNKLNYILSSQQSSTSASLPAAGNNQLHHHHHQQQQPQQQQPIHHQIIQQPKQTSQQAVLNHIVDSDHNSNAMVSQYHLQTAQHQQNPQHNQNQQSNIMNSNSNHNNNTNNNNTMQNNPSIQQKRPGMPNSLTISERCYSFKIASDERRHRDLEQSKILIEIMQKTNTKIEVSSNKDGALNFCIMGKEQSVQAAKNLVLNDFQASVTLTVPVPKSIHGRLLGPKGTRLASIQDETQTKIAIPRKDEDSDIIKITGLKNNAEAALRAIQKCAREFAGKAVEKVTVERIYLLFITGPFNESLKRWEEMGVKVATSGGILPSNNDRETGHADEVTFTISGETNAVNQVKDEIIHIYEDKKKKCTTVNIEVKKAQHKYILGPGGQNLRNLFAKTGVSVELPQESASETITLRGERSKLATALSELYTQAHSETDEFIEVETWLHKYLIGLRKSNNFDFKALGVDVKSFDNKIKLHGPPTEVEELKEALENELETVRKTIITKDLRVEPRIHGYIIGKAGTTVDQIREESGAYVLVPKNVEANEFITLEGTIEAVAIAEEKINAIAKKYEASRKLAIDQQLHGSIIGRGGETIKSIREKFTQVVFTFPEQGSKNNEITISGPKEEVEACYKYLDEFHKQLQENNFQAQVPIKKEIVKYLPDAQLAIKRIKMDHKVKVTLITNDTSNSGSNTSNNKGASKSNQITTSAATVNESPATSNDVSESGKKKGKSKQSNKKQQQQQVNGVDQTSSDTAQNNCENYAVIVGKKEDVDEAKVKLCKLFEELATTIECEVKVSHKLRSYIGPKSRLYRQLMDEFQHKLSISIPSNKQQQEKGGKQQSQKQEQTDKSNASGTSEVGAKDQSAGQESNAKGANNSNGKKDAVNNTNSNVRIDTVKIRGPKSVAQMAGKRFEQLVAECQEKVDKSHQTQVVVEAAVIDKFTYQDKLKINKIRDTQNVKLSIPDARDNPKLQCIIVGYEKSVQAAAKQFKELVKEVDERIDEAIEIPNQLHPRLIGTQGRAVRKLMEDYKVHVKFARPGDANPNSVILTGKPDGVGAAKKHMLKLADQYLSSASANRTQ